MRYYSDKTKNVYDTVEALEAAEKEAVRLEEEARKAKELKAALEKAKNTERAERAKKVDAARKAAMEANKRYQELLRAFCKDYGYFHSSITNGDIPELIDLLNFWMS